MELVRTAAKAVSALIVASVPVLWFLARIGWIRFTGTLAWIQTSGLVS